MNTFLSWSLITGILHLSFILFLFHFVFLGDFMIGCGLLEFCIDEWRLFLFFHLKIESKKKH
uniref:Uncharacterized protein n=1 Tax=Anguilla anguilla TaxID=7936 RepID=A0A0E9X0U4_ANGAN